MRHLSTRLVISHLAVVLLGALATLVIVRALAVSLYDRRMGGRGRGPSGPMLREQFLSTVDQALLIGAGIGGVAAAVLGVWLAYMLARPIRQLRAATRGLAAGRYDTPVPSSDITELQELSDDVAGLGRQLAEVEAHRVRLLGEVAHEMRTPLTVIDGFVEGMIDGVIPATDTSLSQLSDEARRLRRLSDDLSALSQAQEGRLSLTLSPMDLATVTRSATTRLRPQAVDAGLKLLVEMESTLPVTGDADRLAQVITNLLGNALRATPAGGTLTVRGRVRGGNAEVSVADTGEGLAEADLARVFERFYRVPGRRVIEAETGSGIGLTIARSIAEAHGGSVLAASAGVGQGSTFTLRLPLRTEARTPA